MIFKELKKLIHLIPLSHIGRIEMIQVLQEPLFRGKRRTFIHKGNPQAPIMPGAPMKGVHPHNLDENKEQQACHDNFEDDDRMVGFSSPDHDNLLNFVADKYRWVFFVTNFVFRIFDMLTGCYWEQMRGKSAIISRSLRFSFRDFFDLFEIFRCDKNKISTHL